MSNLTLAMNLSNSAVSQYTGFDYDSFAVFNDEPIGAGSNGVNRLEQDPHDQAPIDAHFATGLMDFNTARQKRIRSLVLGAESNNDIEITVIPDEKNSKSHTITFEKSNLKLSGVKSYGVRSQVGRYYQLKIANKNGAQFSVEDIEAVLVILNKSNRIQVVDGLDEAFAGPTFLGEKT